MTDPPFFVASQGLTYGYALSPLHHIISAKSLSKNLEKSMQEDNLVGLSIIWNVKCVNPSDFLDDTLLLGGASKIIVLRFICFFNPSLIY